MPELRNGDYLGNQGGGHRHSPAVSGAENAWTAWLPADASLEVRGPVIYATAVVIAGITYLYANGVYYRERGEGGYEVVPAPAPRPDSPTPERSFVYPAKGQGAQQQASDEYECHRWAVTQSGFDPSGAATGQSNTVSTSARGDYQRARNACLEGRGYTVR